MAVNHDEVKKQLEALAGRELQVEAAQLRFLRYPAGTYDFGDGSVSSHSIFFPSMRCDNTRLLDAGGTALTGADGRRVFRLSQFVCLPQHRLLIAPVNLLATPSASDPFYVTTAHTLIDSNDLLKSDVEITVFGWDRQGNPAPNLAIHWRCRVQSAIIIL
jgi:hypothetical protein